MGRMEATHEKRQNAFSCRDGIAVVSCTAEVASLRGIFNLGSGFEDVRAQGETYPGIKQVRQLE